MYAKLMLGWCMNPTILLDLNPTNPNAGQLSSNSGHVAKKDIEVRLATGRIASVKRRHAQ